MNPPRSSGPFGTPEGGLGKRDRGSATPYRGFAAAGTDAGAAATGSGVSGSGFGAAATGFGAAASSFGAAGSGLTAIDGGREQTAGGACAFGLCDGSGFLYDEASNTAYDCRCRPQRVAHAKARSLSAVIPRRYRHVSFDRPPVTDIDPQIVAATRRFASDIGRHLDRGRGLWFMGPVGTGKTTLAMLVSKAALAAGRSVAIYSLPRLLNEIRDTHRAERSHVNLLDRLTAVDLLHVDDVGAERTTDWVLEELYSIVNSRYEDERSMVITTNILDREALCEQITERTVSRLTEMCDELPLLGDDHRMEPRSM